MEFKIKCDSCQAISVNGIACHETGCKGRFTFTTSRGKEFYRYIVFSLDVWGNKNDGFEVNNRQRCGVIFVPIDADDKTIIRALKQKSLINRYTHFKSFSLSGDEYLIEVDSSKTSEPIYQLELR